MRLLIIGGSQSELFLAGKIASNRGASVRYSSSIHQAMDELRSGIGADLIFIDIAQDIHTFINLLEQERICIDVIACGLIHDKNEAVKAIKFGAKDYLPLPPDEELIAAILQSITLNDNQFIAKSASIKKIISLAKQVAPSDATILITGESGTGKEVMARFVYNESKKKTKPFIAINCAAIPENLLESELFGHEKGAFTGAVARRIGKFEEANGGTLLLDEISEIDIKLQAKLLRVLQEKEVERIGGNQKIKLDVRIIATSNRDLKTYVAEGSFREDLFFRLNVINLHIPPLRERPEDVMEIAKFYVEKYSKLNSTPIKEISKEVEGILTSYTWPGNVRELENTMYRAVLLAQEGIITKDCLMLEQNMIEENKTLAMVEKEFITSTYNKYARDAIKTANILGISVKILQEKLASYEKTL